GKKRQGFSSSTLHGLRTTLSKILGQAVAWRYMEENPARGLSIGERVPKKEPVFLSPHDALRLIQALPEPCRTIVIVATLTGLRIGEIAALRWGRVDFFRGVIQVKETYSEESGFGTPKTRSSVRDVPMSEPVRAALLTHRNRCADLDAAPFVFSSKAGTPIGPKNLANRVLRPTCVKLGLRRSPGTCCVIRTQRGSANRVQRSERLRTSLANLTSKPRSGCTRTRYRSPKDAL